jgi:hypothetical protein
MNTYTISHENVMMSLKKLTGNTKDLSINLFEIFKSNKNIINDSIIIIDDLSNYCSFILYSNNENHIKIKLDIYHEYYDFYVKDEELFIQQNITPLLSTLKLIEDHLKSSVEVVEFFDIRQRIIKSKITFFLNQKKINSLGSVSLFPLFFNRVYKKRMTYCPWIDQ